jgi:hypothetical protein
MRAGWIGTIREFFDTDRRTWLDCLENHLQLSMGETASPSNRTSWMNCHRVLQNQLFQLARKCPEAFAWGIAFEYEIPRERGRRLDVAVLAGECILVLEFKDFETILQPHIDQVAACARDLSSYQAASHNRRVIPVLINTLSDAAPTKEDEVWITGATGLSKCIEQTGVSGQPWTPIGAWVESPYAPLPSLFRAARMIFEHEPLPRIKQAESAGVAGAVEAVGRTIEEAHSRSERHLIFVTGVPGAGKTLTGLQLVYTLKPQNGGEANGVFLSGNGPLVAVLQYALRGKDRSRRGTADPSRVFVRDVLAFVRDYIDPESPLPPEHVWVYDEAQRAWDADRVAERHRHQMSEPEMFLKLGERMPGWSVMVGLIGSGQEIFRGEEQGMEQWNEALRTLSSSWTVHCPAVDAQNRPLADLFTAAKSVRVDEALSLDQSLRSHLALDVPEWVNALLGGDVDHAAHIASRIRSAGFNLYFSEDVEAAKEYVKSRYGGNENARYGLLASNKDRSLPRFNVRNDYPVQKNLKNHVGPFFVDPPDSNRSCCQLRDVATPFECQGLELDFPVVCWGDDLWWDGRCWVVRDSRNSRERDPYRLRINGYRVLLTRGRDGMIVFVPPIERLRRTARLLAAAGCHQLGRTSS